MLDIDHGSYGRKAAGLQLGPLPRRCDRRRLLLSRQALGRRAQASTKEEAISNFLYSPLTSNKNIIFIGSLWLYCKKNKKRIPKEMTASGSSQYPPPAAWWRGSMNLSPDRTS